MYKNIPDYDYASELEQMIAKSENNNKSGSVIYSTKKTLRRGIYYFLGLNPGGNPIDEDKNQWIINNLFPKEDKNAYFEKWNPYPSGRHPYQMSVKSFLASLKFPDDNYKSCIDTDIGKKHDSFINCICCSNLSFLRSKSIGTLKRNLKYYINWDIHDYIINRIVHPSVIIINGISGYNIFNSVIAAKKKEIEIPSGIKHNNKDRMIKVTKVEEDKLLIGLPHFSWPQHAKCTDNEQWRKYGLMKLLQHIDEVLKVRNMDGSQWRFDKQKILRN